MLIVIPLDFIEISVIKFAIIAK